MNVLHIKDISNGQILFMWQRENSLPMQYSHPIPVSNPLDSEEREELRWYLEDYLTYPYSFEFRAKRIEDKMIQWGESLFRMVFIKSEESPDPRDMYQEAVREGLENCELCISSNDPSFLNIPWELVRDPTPGRGYLAPLLGGFYRQRIGIKIEAPKITYTDDNLFRILLVISRPKGEEDIPYGTVSRPLIEALRPLGSRIKLEVLRPPSFEALVEKLNEKPGYYSLVHFDGHGSFELRASDGDPMKHGTLEGHGSLIFETEDGCQFVNSTDLGQELARAKVPLFVLNACQSSVEGENEAFSSVASQLIAVGAKGVVAMGYSVYASSATHFVRKFYENLIKNKCLSECVAAGRRAIYANNLRDSIVGPIEFRDWMVPTLYQQEQNYIPIPSGASPTISDSDKIVQDLIQHAKEACPEGRFGFIGRDYDILRIERKLQDSNRPWILLSGMGGTGKTELAYGFARWYVETGGCNGGVFKTSFKEKADFGQIVSSIAGCATDFSKFSYEEQFKLLVGYLRENPCLLIWDNFESVFGYPQGSEPLATAEELGTISSFLKSLRGGKSRVVITTRKEDENWLGIATGFVGISGLNYRDRAELAKIILDTIGKKPKDFRQDSNYGELLRILNGHPRSLEVVLPQLRKKSPIEIIKVLQHEVNPLGKQIEDTSLNFAFSQLSSVARKHLPFLCLFTSKVSPQILESFVGDKGISKAVYEQVVGETLSFEGWESVLKEAAINGLIESKGGRYYELHPTLPPFFRKQLVNDFGDVGLKNLDTKFIEFYSKFTSDISEDLRNCKTSVNTTLIFEEPNFLRALRSAEINEDWRSVESIARGIQQFYENNGRIAESNAVRMHFIDHIGLKLTLEDSMEKTSLLLYLLASEANYRLLINELDKAEIHYTKMLNYLTSLKDITSVKDHEVNNKIDNNIAVAYFHLGRVEQERNHFNEAENGYRRALDIFERLGLERDVANVYHQFGMIAQDSDHFDKAENWFRRSLGIKERLGLERDVASDYHQLGIIASQFRNQPDEAENWFRKALDILERLGLEQEAARDLHHLGMIAQDRNQPVEAENWFRKSLGIKERLGLERDVASDYHHLGMIAQDRNQPVEAENWFRKALKIRERLGLERDAASDYLHLGIIASQFRNQPDEAENWFRKALDIFERLGLEQNAADVYQNLGIIASQFRNQPDEAENWFRKALDIFERLSLERKVACAYYNLGVFEQCRNHFDEAEDWYRKALEVFERLGLKRYSAAVYKNLEIISQKRQQLD